MDHEHDSISYLGETTFHQRHRRFGIKQSDRLSHMLLVGKTGVGKSSLLASLAIQDLSTGRGFALIDPHGDLADQIMSQATERQRDHIFYLDAADQQQPYGYNPLHKVRPDRVSLAVSGLLETLKKLWPDAWGVRMEHVLRNSIFLLMEQEDSTLPDLVRLYTDKGFRKAVSPRTTNPVVRAFWRDEFAHYPDRMRMEVVAPILNKLGALLSDPTLYRILVEPRTPIRFRTLMDRSGTLLVNLAKGRIGEDSAATLGGLLVSTIGLAALSRADSPAATRPPFFLYVDEFQSFTTLAFANMLAETRKYGLGLILAHQHLDQLDAEIRHTVWGNVGTKVVFRTGAEDAPMFARELAPAFTPLDLMSLPNHYFYVRLMIDGTPSSPFSGRTILL